VRLVAIALVLGLAATARADDDLAEAIRLEAALDYEQALAVVTRILDRGAATDPQAVAELHFYAGRLAAGLGRADEARQHFAIALALNPTLSLPPGTSPKLLAPFEQAHATTVKLRAHATAEGAVIVDADPLGLVARTTIGHEPRAYDMHGNVVWRPEQPPAPPPPPPPSASPSPGIAARWQTWGIVSGGAAVIGGLCAWRFSVAQDDWNQASQDGRHDYTQLRAIEHRGDRWALGANIGFGVAAAAGVTAILLNVFRPAPSDYRVIAGHRYIGVSLAF
jgi:tetratricopeptide (TPR) repeat protein